MPTIGQVQSHFREYEDSAGFWQRMREWTVTAYARAGIFPGDADAALGSVLLANLVPTNQGDSQKIDRSELRDAMPRAVSLFFELRPRVVVPMDKRISRLLIEEFGRHGSTIESGPTETLVPAKSQSYPFYRPAAWRLSTSFGPLMVAESPQHPSKRNFYDPDVLDAYLGTVLTEALGVHR